MAAPRVRRAAASRVAAAVLAAALGASLSAAVAAAESKPAARVEARSADFFAVGLVSGDAMSIHLSRVLDNAPLRDAAVTLTLRGAAHPAVAEADGSYSVHAAELSLPGPAAVVFTVVQGATEERLPGTLQIPASAGGSPSGAVRQYGWWALNFAVCIGFLYLWSRRKKAASDD